MNDINSTLSIPKGGALDGNKHRVIVSTDIGGTDPDDFQSMVHLLLYADVFEIEGLISSSGMGGKGSVLDIHTVIDCYEKDFNNLKKHSSDYPEPAKLRSITKQGAIEYPPYAGFHKPTDGSQLIIDCARKEDTRPLYILGWGGIEDVAQALHDAPDILPKIRFHWVGGPNKKWGPNQYEYVVKNHSKLWIIEDNSTYRGWFTGGNQNGQWGNSEFVKKYIAGKGALGNFFSTKLGGVIKMGDTPTVSWLLKGMPSDPTQPSWGGQFVRTWDRPYKFLNRLPIKGDLIEIFGVLEIAISIDELIKDDFEVYLNVENQSIPGHIFADGTIRFRFCPKSVQEYSFTINSNLKSLNNKKGVIESILPDENVIENVSDKFPNWWTDTPNLKYTEGNHHGAKTVSKWREDYLNDFAKRIARCVT
ncbi:MAG: DUF1593 domain-containing protein [Clostridiales bacterium]